MSKENPIINLFEHPDYTLAKGVGRFCWWHGATYDRTKVSRATCEMMANDPQTLWIKHSDARIARETEERVKALIPPAAPTKTVAEVAKEATPAAAKAATTASTDDTPASTGGRVRGRRNAAPAGDAPGSEE